MVYLDTADKLVRQGRTWMCPPYQGFTMQVSAPDQNIRATQLAH